MASPTITVAMPGVPAFLQGMTDFLQVSGWLALCSSSLCPARHWCLVAIMSPLGRNPGDPLTLSPPFWR